jgi:hypothetical protein
MTEPRPIGKTQVDIAEMRRRLIAMVTSALPVPAADRTRGWWWCSLMAEVA